MAPESCNFFWTAYSNATSTAALKLAHVAHKEIGRLNAPFGRESSTALAEPGFTWTGRHPVVQVLQANPVSLPQPVQPVTLPQPVLPLEPDQVMLAHNSKPLTSSKHTIATQARRSGCPGRPSTRAEEANKIGDTSSQQVTKAAPKRKQNAVQPHASESRKKSQK
ncbi:uncharacterized protein F5891DRAFT_979780 [Suillus fuscotomentosus]|uniref:Uncharacterized protein n=1 Tax=Suillus fuscotomentosus TaxID=1912939 RepID=A0AAD4E7N6_9AGAM|nr:uncharacterized protein F5891DRAFT_979780 [Suillus fuscotomentosus]KAG1901253.1 hypothetical protein F5891DRAFT_979780 [Suillus fuscotomentosus]